RHVCQRDGNGGQSDRIETKRKARNEADGCGSEACMFYRRPQRLRFYHSPPRFRSINALRNCTSVGIEVKMTSPSMAIEGSVITPSSMIKTVEHIYFTPLDILYRLPIQACGTAGAIE